MTNWNGPITGDWSLGANWDSGNAPTMADDVSIDATGASPYLVNITAGSTAGSLTIDSAQAIVSEAAGGSLALQFIVLNAGQLVLEGASNPIGEVSLRGGVLALGAGALDGSINVFVEGGELTALNGDVGAYVEFDGGGTIDAATGTTANFGKAGWGAGFSQTGTITIGTSARAGAVVWNGDAGVSFGAFPQAVDIAFGALRNGDAFGQDLVSTDAGTTIEATGTYDLNGFGAALTGGLLTGAGAITNSSATAAHLTLKNGDFSGVISGPISLEAQANTGLKLEGINTYTQGTTIDSGATLTLGGANGSVAGSIVDNGVLSITSSGHTSLGAITGAGKLIKTGTGTLVLSHTSGFKGGASITGGTVIVANAKAFGASHVKLDNTELVVTAPIPGFRHTFDLAGAITLATPTGQTTFVQWLGPFNVQNGASLTFGDSAHRGNIEFAAVSGTVEAPLITFAAGVTTDLNKSLGQVLNAAQSVTVDAGATYEMNGGPTATRNLTDAGTITDSGAAITLGLSGGNSVTGLISGAINLSVTGGTTTLASANTYDGATTLTGGTVTIGNAGAFSSGDISIDGAELAASKTLSVANAFTLSGQTTLAAAAHTTLTLTAADTFAVGSSMTLTFGDATNTGTVIVGGAGVFDSGGNTVAVADGVLKLGDADFANFLGMATAQLTVSAGAKLDLNGVSLALGAGCDLQGDGAITDTGAAATLTLDNADFTGTIGGALALEVGGAVTLGGANTNTQGTTIDNAATLTLGDGGLLAGQVTDDGTLIETSSTAPVLTAAISGSGEFVQDGTGETTLKGSNSYGGGTLIELGELDVTSNASLGSGGVITLTGGALVGLNSVSFSQDVDIGGTVELGAAAGKTLKLAAGTLSFGAGRLVIGDGLNTGTVIMTAASGISSAGANLTVEIAGGTLRGGDGTLSTLLAGAGATAIDSGGVLDLGGHALTIAKLTGSGTLTNTGPAAHLVLTKASFSGVLAGAFTTVDVKGAVALTGSETFSGTARLFAGGDLTTFGTFAEAVQFDGGGTLTLAFPSRFTGVISGFAAGSVIDLRNITTGSAASVVYNSATKVLTVSDGTHTDHLTFTGALAQGNFQPIADTTGGTEIEFAAAARAPGAVRLAQALASFGSGSAAGPAAPMPDGHASGALWLGAPPHRRAG
jgi:autotransporter-associated beta strand protein